MSNMGLAIALGTGMGIIFAQLVFDSVGVDIAFSGFKRNK